MDARDALFEDLQTLSDDAEELGLVDVALVLEFAMDVFLMKTKEPDVSNTTVDAASFDAVGRDQGALSGWSTSSFPLAQLYQKTG